MSFDACLVKPAFCEGNEAKSLVEQIPSGEALREGNRRDPATWNNYTTTLPDFIIDRGYTGHEHLDVFGMINMNGRVGVYPERQSRFGNPVIARFLSPDPYIQAPDVPQNYNGYAYCLNNPLKYSDPSGNFIQYIIAGTFFYLQGAYNNRDQASGKWQLNPFKWGGKDSPGLVIGISTNTTFTSTTFYAGVNWNNGMGDASFGYNTGSGFGYGFDPGNPGELYYPEMSYSKPEQNAVGAIWRSQQRNKDENYSYQISGAYGYSRGNTTVDNSGSYTSFEGVQIISSSLLDEGSAFTVPGVGIYIHPSVSNDRDLLRHEFGHILQARAWGPAYYFCVVAPTSYRSYKNWLKNPGSFSHDDTWSEWSASRLSYEYFGQPADWRRKEYPIYPVNFRSDSWSPDSNGPFDFLFNWVLTPNKIPKSLLYNFYF